MNKITVLIIEDHKLFMETLVMMINQDQRFHVAGTTDPDEGLAYLHIHATDIVILDLNLGKVNGLDLIKSLRNLRPAVKVIVLSSSYPTALVKAMMKEGAKGYLTKNVSEAELINALEMVRNGDRYICGEIKEQLAKEVIEPPAYRGAF